MSPLAAFKTYIVKKGRVAPHILPFQIQPVSTAQHAIVTHSSPELEVGKKGPKKITNGAPKG